MWNPEERFVFIHPQKCAGTSLRSILRKKYSEDKCKLKYEPRGSGHWRANQWADHIKNTTGEDISEYFVFGVVRNPWDRAVSYFHHLQRHRKYNKPFWQFIHQDSYITSHTYNIYNKFNINNNYVMDFVVKQENFEHDISELMKKLGIGDYDIEHHTHDTKREGKVYHDFFDSDDLIDQVAAISQFEINKFGYKF